RYLRRKGADLVPLGEDAGRGRTRNAGWWAEPGEDWVVLPRAEWSKLLPAGKVRPGDSWEPDRQAASRLLTRFYPPTENHDVGKHRIERQSLTARVLSMQDGVVRVRLDGRLKMKHPFYHRPDDSAVEAAVVGFLEYDPAKGTIRALEVVTDGATYGT